MVLSLLAASVLLAPAPKPVTAKITSASLFKNGFAVVLRSIEVPGPGTYELSTIPQASLGTLWFSTTDGLKLGSVVATSVEKTTTVSPSLNPTQLLEMNVGKQLVLGLKNGDEVTGGRIAGKLLSANVALVMIDDGKRVLGIPTATITSVAAASGTLVTRSKATESHRALRFVVQGANKGRIQMLSLERGLSWLPGYMVDITKDDQLSLVAKATVTNDLEEFARIETRFVTGFPNLPYLFSTDPLVIPPPVAQAAFDNRMVFGGFGGGGMGGMGGGAPRELMTQNAAAPMTAGDITATMNPSPVQGTQEGDLFFYKQPDVSLKKGDRGYYIMFTAASAYTHVYTWTVGDSVVNDVEYRAPDRNTAQEVWHSLRFKNNSGRPLTTGVATTYRNGEILGQDVLNYTPNGADAEVKITKALDIRADAEEEEVSRERVALRIRSGYEFDLVTLKGTLIALNQKTEAVDVKVTKEITGEVVSTTGEPTVVKTAKRLSAINPAARLEWELKLAPGQSQTVTYEYKVYIRV